TGHDSADGMIRMCPKADCANHITTLAEKLPFPCAVAVDATTVSWMNCAPTAGGMNAPPMTCPITGCGGVPTVSTCIAGEPQPALAIDTSSVYWNDGRCNIWKCPKNGCALAPVLLATGQYNMDSLRVDATTAFWTATDMSGGEDGYSAWSCPT